MNRRRKLTIVGAGNVGATAAHWAAQKGLADIVLTDVVDGLAQGKALDLKQALPIDGYDVNVIGTRDYSDTKDSNVVVITAGSPRKPGMSRDDLLEINAKIVKSVTAEIAKHSPNAIIIVVSNPLDAMVHVAAEVSGFPRERIFGMSGVLDSARFRTFLAMELGCSVHDVAAVVLGGHGDTMVPLVRYSTMAGVPVTDLISPKRLDEIIARTRHGGAEIVNFLKTGSAHYAPSAAIIEMVESILLDRKKILPTCVKLNGEYGIKDAFVGVPAKLGQKGMEKVIEIKLNEDEKAALKKSSDSVRELMEAVKRYL